MTDQVDAEAIAARYSAGEVAMARRYADSLVRAAKALGATPSDMMGLWEVPGHPELTNGQLISLWRSSQSATFL